MTKMNLNIFSQLMCVSSYTHHPPEVVDFYIYWMSVKPCMSQSLHISASVNSSPGRRKSPWQSGSPESTNRSLQSVRYRNINSFLQRWQFQDVWRQSEPLNYPEMTKARLIYFNTELLEQQRSGTYWFVDSWPPGWRRGGCWWPDATPYRWF